MITWRKEYCVGVASVDEQHKKLVNILNKLLDGMKAQMPPKALKAVLKELISYTKTHFVHEEDLMRQAGYSQLAEHRQKHQMFIEKLRTYVDSFREGKTLALPVELSSFLQNWLVNHIMKVDKQYASTFAAKGIS